MDKTQYKGILVFAEQREGVIQNVAFEPVSYTHLDVYKRQVPVDEVIFSIGDDQDIKSGLSSYGAEMLRLNRIIESVKEGKQVLALIDCLLYTSRCV